MRFREKDRHSSDETDTSDEWVPPRTVGLRDRIAHFTWFAFPTLDLYTTE
jgi:hypothetical protein